MPMRLREIAALPRSERLAVHAGLVSAAGVGALRLAHRRKTG